MLLFSLLFFTVALSNFLPIFGAGDEDDVLLEIDDQSRVSELASTREEQLNCFLQFDQYLADKWTSQLGLAADFNAGESPSVINRLKEEGGEEDRFPEAQRLSTDTRTTLDELRNCMNDMTKNLKNLALKKCMRDLVESEIENDGFISLPQLFDYSLELPFLTFLDIRELAKVLYQNRTWEELGSDEIKVFQKASDYLRAYKSGRDKVFLIDQSCEWKDFNELIKREDDIEDMLKEFKRQVVKSISLKIAHGIFNAGDLKPGTWIGVRRRWVPVRIQNLNDIDSMIENLKKQRFTTAELCRYATTLGKFFAELELKVLLAEKFHPLHIKTGDINEKSKSKESQICREGVTTTTTTTINECKNYQKLYKVYEDNLRCTKSFGKLFSNHVLYSIIETYVNIEPRLTYPEIVCKRNSPDDKISVRYCRCVGSFCTFQNVGEIDAKIYKLKDGVVTRV